LLSAYAAFVSAFRELSPYELDHLSEMLMVKLEDIFDQRNAKHKMQVTLQDVTHALVRGMRDIKVMIAENRKNDAECQLKRAQIETFRPEVIDLPRPKRNSGKPRLVRE